MNAPNASAASSERTEAETLRIALVADADRAGGLIDLIARTNGVTLCALAGPERIEPPAGVEWFDDTRAMVAQRSPDGLCVAVSPREAEDVCRLALERRVGVFRLPPIGRNFTATSELLKKATADDASAFVVQSIWPELEPIIEELLSGSAFAPRFAEVTVRAAGPTMRDWRASQSDAGGGVVLLDAYDPIEAVIALRGLPDNVSAGLGHYRPVPNEPPRDTEDAAAAVLRYEDGGMVSVRAGWDVAPFERSLQFHAAERTLVVGPRGVELLDRAGQRIDVRTPPADPLPREFERFLQVLVSDQPTLLQREHLLRHLQVAAVIEAVYLSAQTWHPETPLKLFEVHGWPTRW